MCIVFSLTGSPGTSFTLYHTKSCFCAFCYVFLQHRLGTRSNSIVYSACFCLVMHTECAAFHLTPPSPPPSLRGFGLWLAKLVSYPHNSHSLSFSRSWLLRPTPQLIMWPINDDLPWPVQSAESCELFHLPVWPCCLFCPLLKGALSAEETGTSCESMWPVS